MERYIVSVGDLFDPTHYGPFDSAHEAEVWVSRETAQDGVIDDESTRIVVLNLP